MSLVPARWEHVARAVALRDGLGSHARIIGNGDALSLEDAEEKAHVSGADGVMLGRAIFGNPWLFHPLKDLSNISLAERFRVLIEHTYLFEELLPFRLRFEPLQAGQPVVTDDVRVTPFRSSHLDGLRASFQKKYPQDFASYCFLLESDRLRIGHSADIGAPEDLSPLLEKPLDLLVCELAHFKPEDLFRFLKGREIGRIVFTHLGRRYWADLEGTRQLAARMLPDIPFSIAQNGEEFTL